MWNEKPLNHSLLVVHEYSRWLFLCIFVTSLIFFNYSIKSNHLNSNCRKTYILSLDTKFDLLMLINFVENILI